MAVATAWKRTDYLRKHKIVMMKMTYASGDTSVTVSTGLKIIYSYTISTYSLTTKTILQATVSGGTITVTVTDPGAAAYFFVTAIGI